MSEKLYMEPEIFKKENKDESIVDIYVSSESLRVYESPWVEGQFTITAGSAENQHSGKICMHVSSNRSQLKEIKLT